MIETVRGPIKPEEFGICACHEHVHIDLSHIKKSNDTALTDYDRVKEDVARFIKAGGKAFIEMTNVGMGRNIQFMRRLSEELDMHIVASTGCYKDPFIPAEALSWNREQFAAFMLQEIEEGIDGSPSKPGVIGEIGSSLNEFKPVETELFHGAIIAAKESGLPLATHTTLGTMALEQVELFAKEGLPLDQVIIGHQDLNENDDVVLEVLAAGCYVAMDTIGKENYRSDQERLTSLLRFIEAGYGDKIMLSTDITRNSHLFAAGGQGFDYTLREFQPRMEASGLSQQEIRKLLIENPANAFSKREGTS
ncbi:phosphotriesterase-related protein [Shouchella clausii]|uniref:phosphotriesterase family protein n=1 Tax=Shouchella clausii TaxID=79880 RepID=UPI000BA630F4|nr:phosphotriesterase-related protein [Shouchella clausii]MEB5479429.1 phosphotriesterase-related protein [Shouchella clausii]PAE82092.1 phosphotriesterase [Shouchella clausii]PAF08873.1 phosphotriesterase [Shouchella clausii]